jgi:hypothetical protein
MLWTRSTATLLLLGLLMTGTETTTTATKTQLQSYNTAPATPTLADVTGERSATANRLDNYRCCSGTIYGTTIDAFDKKYQGTSVITWTFDEVMETTRLQLLPKRSCKR